MYQSIYTDIHIYRLDATTVHLPGLRRRDRVNPNTVMDSRLKG